MIICWGQCHQELSDIQSWLLVFVESAENHLTHIHGWNCSIHHFYGTFANPHLGLWQIDRRSEPFWRTDIATSLIRVITHEIICDKWWCEKKETMSSIKVHRAIKHSTEEGLTVRRSYALVIVSGTSSIWDCRRRFLIYHERQRFRRRFRRSLKRETERVTRWRILMIQAKFIAKIHQSHLGLNNQGRLLR